MYERLKEAAEVKKSESPKACMCWYCIPGAETVKPIRRHKAENLRHFHTDLDKQNVYVYVCMYACMCVMSSIITLDKKQYSYHIY